MRGRRTETKSSSSPQPSSRMHHTIAAWRGQEAIAESGAAEDKVSAMLDVIFVGPTSNLRFYLVFFDFLGYAARNDRFAEVGSTFHEVCNAPMIRS